ncbi:hypothetical protein ACJX0J_020386 [Zea mays]
MRRLFASTIRDWVFGFEEFNVFLPSLLKKGVPYCIHHFSYLFILHHSDYKQFREMQWCLVFSFMHFIVPICFLRLTIFMGYNNIFYYLFIFLSVMVDVRRQHLQKKQILIMFA